MKTIFLVYSDILKTTRTVDDAQKLASEIDFLNESMFHEGKKEFENVLKKVKPKLAQIIQEEFINKDPTYSNKDMIKDFLTQLKERVLALKTVTLEIAFEPSQETIENIHNWILKNIDTDYVLDIVVDNNIVGGVNLTYEGKYKDFSLKKKLDEAFETKRQEILHAIP